jgi:hypothetical protein
MFPTKALGPDGFPTHFSAALGCGGGGGDVTKAVLNIVQGKESAESINDTVLIRILKVKNPTLLVQFRPISLCNVFIKLPQKC